MADVVGGERAGRWCEEAAFFDKVASRAEEAALPLDPLALRRYTRRRLRNRFSMEFRFARLGWLGGRSVLDVGCGEGLNAVLLAKLGGRVTGIDISNGALEIARHRAWVNGVAERTRFVCAPLEVADLPSGSFDIVWGDGILHHVLPDLEAVLRRLVEWTKPGGMMIFSEPINLSPLLSRLRRLAPMRTDVTPGERPLVRAEMDLVARLLPGIEVRPFSLFGRLERFLLVGFNYERSPASRRALVSALAGLDALLLSLPWVEDLAGTCVMYGVKP